MGLGIGDRYRCELFYNCSEVDLKEEIKMTGQPQSQPKELTGLQNHVLSPSALVRKFISLGWMLFFIAVNYVILRDMKTTLLITATDIGTLTFVKLYLSLPVYLMSGILYVLLCHIVSREKLFYVILIPFLIFFAAFALFIYPNPQISKNGIVVFYLLAELWGPVILTVLFWQFANEIMSVKEAKKVYILLGLFPTVGMIVGSLIITHYSQATEGFPSEEAIGITLNYLMAVLTICGIATLAVYYWMTKKVLNDPRIYTPTPQVSTEKGSPLSFMKSLENIFKSPYLWLIIGIIFASTVWSNIIQIIWKGQFWVFYPTKNDYNAIMGTLSVTAGSLGIAFMFIEYIVLARCRWITAALVPAILTFIMGLIFLGLILYADGKDPLMPFMGTSLSKAIVWIGNLSVRIPQISSLFAVTLLIAYIPLDQDIKTKGRAVVEIIFARIIISIGYFLGTQLLMTGGFSSGVRNYTNIIPWVALVLIALMTLWILCVKALSKRFEALVSENETRIGTPIP